MNVTAKLLVTTILACTLINLQAQTGVKVSQPELSLKNGKVQIAYDLLNSSKSEKFTVRVEITGEGGNQIPARSLTGDLGEGVSGGNNKRVIWDIEADSIFLDEEIFVEVYALPEAPPVAEVIPEEEEDTAETISEETLEDEAKDPLAEAVPEGSAGKELSRTSLIIQSIAFPGLGLSRLTGSPHWLRGVAGYGCLAGSVILNRSGWNSYQDYLGSEDPNEVDDLFDKAYNARRNSQILGYAAIGIWVVDLTWTIVGTSRMNKDQLSTNRKGFSIGTTVEPVSNVPLIALRYQF